MVGIGLAASCLLGPMGCVTEDDPDNAGGDASADTSVQMDVSSDQRDGGRNCVGGGDAARDGALGMMLVQQIGCARCHQDEPVDAGLFLSGRSTSLAPEAGVFPKNLTPDPATGLGCWTDQQIIGAIMAGLDENGQPLCTRMPRYGTSLDGGNVQAIVDYLRSIPAVNKQIPETTSCPPPAPRSDGGTDAGDGGAPTDGDSPDATTDHSDGGAPEGGADDAAHDTGADMTTPDAGADATQDTGADVTPDAGADVVPDAGADVTTPDALHDTADVGGGDAGLDAEVDAPDGADATADAESDANG
jgi:hypothetical protein